jgi:hypothetical protein
LVDLLEAGGATVSEEVKAAFSREERGSPMKSAILTDTRIIAAGIVALGLVLGGFLAGGIYDSHTGIKGVVIYRVNRFTGAATACFLNGTCNSIPDAARTASSQDMLDRSKAKIVDATPSPDFLAGAVRITPAHPPIPAQGDDFQVIGPVDLPKVAPSSPRSTTPGQTRP